MRLILKGVLLVEQMNRISHHLFDCICVCLRSCWYLSEYDGQIQPCLIIANSYHDALCDDLVNSGCIPMGQGYQQSTK